MEQRRKKPAKRKATGPKFRLFLHLPLELRIQIWQHAIFDRVLKIEKSSYRLDRVPGLVFRSPTPAPAVTRVCHESRKYCSYCRYPTTDKKISGRYIWMNTAYDTIQVCNDLRSCCKEEYTQFARTSVRAEITSLRITTGQWCAYNYYFVYGTLLSTLFNIRTLDILVDKYLGNWTDFPSRTPWVVGTKPYIRVVSCETGEWMDEITCGVYADWLDTKWRFKYSRRTGVVAETAEERAKKVEDFKGLPRTGLDFW